MRHSNFKSNSPEGKLRNLTEVSGNVMAATYDLLKQKHGYHQQVRAYFERSLSRLIEKGIVPEGSSIDSEGTVRVPGKTGRIHISELL